MTVVKNLSSGGYLFQVIPKERFGETEGKLVTSQIFYTLSGKCYLSYFILSHQLNTFPPLITYLETLTGI